MDKQQVKAQLAETSRQLAEATTALTAALSALGSTAGDRSAVFSQPFEGVVRGLAAATSTVLELDRLLDASATPLVATRACPRCGKRGMAAATVCGHCWINLTPVSD